MGIFSYSWVHYEITSSAESPLVSGRLVNLPNYGYVNLNEVGNAEDCSVQCRTDLTTCCSGAQIMQGVGHCGDWFLPGI